MVVGLGGVMRCIFTFAFDVTTERFFLQAASVHLTLYSVLGGTCSSGMETK